MLNTIDRVVMCSISIKGSRLGGHGIFIRQIYTDQKLVPMPRMRLASQDYHIIEYSTTVFFYNFPISQMYIKSIYSEEQGRGGSNK